MVRHHVKKKKNDPSKLSAQKKKEQEKKQLEEELQNLDRFAGSSDEEEEGSDSGVENDDESSDEEGSAASEEEDGPDSEAEGSDDADEDDDYADVYQEEMKVSKEHKQMNNNREESDSDNSGGEDSEDDYVDAIRDDQESDDDDERISSSYPSAQNAKGVGMANAMARILGGQMMQPEDGAPEKKSTKPVILSKTTTPLQRLQQKMKTEEQALRQKRQNRRAENLSAMRLPLAPSAGMSAEKLWKETKKSKRKRDLDDDGNDAAAIANEIEGERAHRRIATRGVVALFNAISKHRAAVAAEATAKEEEKRLAREEGRRVRKNEEGGGVSSQTKHGFLDLIKKSAPVGGQGDSISNGTRQQQQDSSSSNNAENVDKKEKMVGWSALKDDYMMASKLKDWDKMSDDSDDDETGTFNDAALSDDEDSPVKVTKSSRKRTKV